MEHILRSQRNKNKIIIKVETSKTIPPRNVNIMLKLQLGQSRNQDFIAAYIFFNYYKHFILNLEFITNAVFRRKFIALKVTQLSTQELGGRPLKC